MQLQKYLYKMEKSPETKYYVCSCCLLQYWSTLSLYNATAN